MDILGSVSVLSKKKKQKLIQSAHTVRSFLNTLQKRINLNQKKTLVGSTSNCDLPGISNTLK